MNDMDWATETFALHDRAMRFVAVERFGERADQLAGFIKEAHGQVQAHTEKAADAAYAAGVYLWEAKMLVDDDHNPVIADWPLWVKQEARLSYRTAWGYMQLVIAVKTGNLSTKQIAESTQAEIIRQGLAFEREERRSRRRVAPVLEDAMELRIGRFQDVLADIPDYSVPLILTDPPYGNDAEPLYRDLAAFAAKKLIGGGSLICYTGHACLPRDIAILGEHLDWVWQLAMLHDQTQRFPGANVLVGYKPVLWFSQGPVREHMAFCDLLDSPARDKVDHPWGQGEGGVKFVIEALTLPGELVVDPFAGTCQWGRLAVKAGCRWLGADVKMGGDAIIVE